MTGKSIAFDQAAGYYDQTRGFPPGVERGVAETMARVAGLKPTDKILEIGIGTGRIALPLAPYVGACYGVDLAQPMVAKLIEKRSGEAVYPVLADATRLPFPDGSFDAAVAVHIFHLIPAYPDALKEAARVLKPGAMLVHGWNMRLADDSLTDVWNAATRSYDQGFGAVPLPPDERDKMLPSNGWRLESEGSYVFPVERVPAQFIEAFRSRVYSRLWSMPDDIHAAGMAALEAHLAEHGIDPQQPQTIESEFRVQIFSPPA